MMGEYTDPSTGNTVTGDLTRFFAGDPTAGRFMMGDFPYMIFCLPAVALAIIHPRVRKRKNDLRRDDFCGAHIYADRNYRTG